METLSDYRTDHFFKRQNQDQFLRQTQNDESIVLNKIKVENKSNIYIADWQVEYPENQPDRFKPVQNVGLSSHR